MTLQTLSIEYNTYTDDSALQSTDKNLLDAARKAAMQAYNPYSQFFVGCAILLDNQQIVTGFNIENAAYSVCICAERTTLSAALTQHPTAKIIALAVSTYQQNNANNQPTYPCGVCRQFISECEDKNETVFPIIVGGQTGQVNVFASIKQLLPFSFGKNNLLP
jgi:cytidine deaminase